MVSYSLTDMIYYLSGFQVSFSSIKASTFSTPNNSNVHFKTSSNLLRQQRRRCKIRELLFVQPLFWIKAPVEFIPDPDKEQGNFPMPNPANWPVGPDWNDPRNNNDQQLVSS